MQLCVHAQYDGDFLTSQLSFELDISLKMTLFDLESIFDHFFYGYMSRIMQRSLQSCDAFSALSDIQRL